MGKGPAGRFEVTQSQLDKYEKQPTSLRKVYLSPCGGVSKHMPVDLGVRQARYETCMLALD